MSDSKMAKRIFTTRGEAPTLDPARTPSCYYHKCAITHFCVKKKCTLPLCQECLPIHKREHINNKEIPNEGILEYDTARDDALNAFQERKEEIEKVQERFKSKVIEYKAKIVELVNELLDKFVEDALVTDGNLEIISEIEERTSEIKRGSLKELIRYYEDIYGAEHFRKLYKMYTGQYLTNFKFQLDRKTLEKLTKDGIKNMNFLTQQAPITEISEKTEEGEAKSSPKFNKEDYPNSLMPQKDPIKPKIELKPEVHKPQILERHQNFSQNSIPNRRATSEEDEESEISSYQLLKSKKKIEEGNIYTQNPSKLTENFSQNPSKNNSNVSSSSKSKKKKGLSLAKSHKELPTSQSSNFFTTKGDEGRAQNNNRKSNWRQFVNMKETHPENEAINIPISQPNTVLNPKQMRELIVKKKIEEKQKELKVNKSAEFLVPLDRAKI